MLDHFREKRFLLPTHAQSETHERRGSMLGVRVLSRASGHNSAIESELPMMTAEHSLPKPFALPEYELAQFEFFGLAIKGMMKAKSSIFAQIPEAEPTENLPVTQNTMLSGEVVATPPLELATKVEIKLDDIRLRNLESLGELIDSLAEERLTHFMAHLCDMLGRTSE